MTHVEEADLKRYLLQTPDSIVFTGKDTERKIGKTFGNIHKAETARKYLRAGLYSGSPNDTWGFDD